MAAPRLSDAQKQELVNRFQSGESTQDLAEIYGCSPNTVIRVVKAAIEPSVYEKLKRQRVRRGPQSSASQTTPSETTVAPTAEPEPAAPQPEPPVFADPSDTEEPPSADAAPFEPDPAPSREADPAPGNEEPEDDLQTRAVHEGHEAARGLAIEDADDFDDVDDDSDEDDDDDTSAEFLEHTFVEVPVSLTAVLDQPLTSPRPWRVDEMPASAYMLVDKTVELQARPLAEIPELGRLAPEELELQALVLYSNPRQAKRQCGRTQRVIKVPDVGVFERTASYLLRQGICRVVLEGALYALPEA